MHFPQASWTTTNNMPYITNIQFDLFSFWHIYLVKCAVVSFLTQNLFGLWKYFLCMCSFFFSGCCSYFFSCMSQIRPKQQMDFRCYCFFRLRNSYKFVIKFICFLQLNAINKRYMKTDTKIGKLNGNCRHRRLRTKDTKIDISFS